MILETIIAATRQELTRRKQRLPEGALRELLQDAPAGDVCRGGMLAALRQPGVSIIAEVKRASPSRGTLNAALRAGAQAVTYALAGAAAISILTEPSHFKGSLSDLREAHEALATAGVARPLLRKDFIVDSYQLVEAVVWGADAALLIAAALDDAALAHLLQEAQSLGLTPLVEVHDEQELARVLPLHPPLIGINNRNLKDMTVDRGVTRRLRTLIPPATVVVAESGIREPAHMAELAALGVDAALIGEALVTAPDAAARLRELLQGGR
jgi:indole-3-glycerol phosphate synthase